ncbi:hypothetical protein EIP91_010340 [Steccherinum ochraceum]|uniref:Uncharacterized protein n=1 Tax=Steccherinum ochraceum TaxID=92696 RepID=A0A4R0R0Q0_9APHY|nr:hypothetical protein EIP91_010340 [Steccherinum ochraceum]
MMTTARASAAAAAAAAPHNPPDVDAAEYPVAGDNGFGPGLFEPPDEPAPHDVDPEPADPAQHLRGKYPKATVEEVEDEGDVPPSSHRERFSDAFPQPAGVPLSFERSETSFEQFKASNPGEYGPFEDEEDWELGKFLMQNLGVNKTGEFLKLGKIKHGASPSFTTAKSLREKIDGLPQGPEWYHEYITVQGDAADEDGVLMKEELELWRRDPLDLVRELIGNPMFNGHMAYAPEKVFAGMEGDERVLDEMWTADWWWKVQEKLPAGATVAPLIIASDETQLSQFGGDKKAWPVYLTIGNIEKSVRRKPSNHGTILLGYLPSSKLKCFTKHERRVAGWQLFHYCMDTILSPIRKAGEEGVEMLCADGFMRRVYPILAAYIADYPEQLLVTCCKKGWCPKCKRRDQEIGDLAEHLGTLLRRQDETLDILQREEENIATREFGAQGLRPLYKPFWAGLPHADIFMAITPDILHQLHKGVFKDHLVKWCLQLAGPEIDKRFACQIGHPGLRHFRLGISHIKQSTGAEHKQMEKVFGCVLPGAVQQSVVHAAIAILDFIYYAQLRSHTTTTLAALRDALRRFHQHKDAFVQLKCRPHFRIPKVHAMEHYAMMIEELGSADGYSTENPERLHIDLAKNAYRASNRKGYLIQMTTWLTRQEALFTFQSYLAWTRGPKDEPEDEGEDEEDEEIREEVEKDDEEGWDEDEDSVQAGNEGDNADPDLHRFVAKKAPHPNVALADITSKYEATQFQSALAEFLKNHGVHTAIDSRRDTFDTYNGMTVMLPDLPAVDRPERRQRIRTTPAVAARPGRRAVPAHLDTVLVRSLEGNHVTENTGLEGLRVAQVKVIFNLPSRLQDSSRILRSNPAPLAYIEWFRPFSRKDVYGLYKLKRSTRGTLSHAEVVPLTRIVRSCHIVANFKTEIPHTWTPFTVLQQCSEFYLNPWVSLDDFLCMR